PPDRERPPALRAARPRQAPHREQLLPPLARGARERRLPEGGHRPRDRDPAAHGGPLRQGLAPPRQRSCPAPRGGESRLTRSSPCLMSSTSNTPGASRTTATASCPPRPSGRSCERPSRSG